MARGQRLGNSRSESDDISFQQAALADEMRTRRTDARGGYSEYLGGSDGRCQLKQFRRNRLRFCEMHDARFVDGAQDDPEHLSVRLVRQ